ncbi:hypothetical protein BCR41DRAFT_46053 [Lobosporangium transversale]|uniref:BRCT domain-containing protein n=1 Tax=Lobosporangium transversale TaxID=64571 RepID=A0A1Y2GPZ8_9FUNG|nr:hypothetical protein BCR41DRAFT_46053 [Lobosporangium transversale]ORZ18361.1 hypothetical protein BCR41DRAFT_46053 [Lobosporangium transversale]|eukprot:XP_021882156.1 hypothetical protein BCR41DRAFT_46053 [Lobosporangium transversale]
MSEVQQSPKDWPLAELKVAINLSGQPKELYFPLYPGDNTVGHNGLIPANEKPNDISLNFYPIIKSRHFLISCTKDPMIFIKSTVERPEDANAVIMGENGRDGLSMNNVYVWEFLESRRVCIGNGLITLSCTYLGRNRRYGLPRSAMGQTRIGREISMIRNQPMASTSQIKKEEPDTSITNLDGTHQVPIQDRPLASDATDSVPDEFEPMSKTLTLPEITQELERPTDEIRNEYYDPDRLPASNEDGNVDEDDNSDSEGEEEPSHSRVPSRFLPDDITKIRREPVPPTPDLLPTQPYVSEDHQTERTDHDALTQLLEPTQAYLDPDAPTQILDPALDYSEVRIKQEENTQLDTMAKPHLQPHPRNAPVHEDETADYQQGRVCETQSTHAETQSTQSPRNSPSLELEPGTASGPTRRIVERIPATPTDEQTEARRVRQEGIENKKSRAQLIEEEGKVPQTPEHAPVSQASTAELNPASGSRANSYDRSFGSGGHDDNNNDSVFHIAATAEDGQEGDRTRRLSCDEDDPMAAELQEGLPRAILKGSQEPVTTPSSSPPLQAPVDRGYGPEGSGHSRPSSRTSQRTKEGSPKHGIESDSERDSPKPSKLIRTESQVETTESMAERPTASTQVRATPSRMMSRRSTLDMDTHKAKVMISAPGLTDKDKKKWAEAIESLGGAYKEDYKEATILVFEGNSRTSKFMCAIVRGIPIVTMNWLEDSKNSHEFKP